MALRDKLRERVTPLLEPGEQVRQVFLAQTGPSPYWFFLTYLVLFWIKYYIVAVTDREVAVFRAGLWTPTKPKGFHQRYPRGMRLGAPLSGLWARTMIGSESMHVHKRFHKDVEAADQELALFQPYGSGPPTASPPPAAPAPPAPPAGPTHAVPPTGLPAWSTPDPSVAPATTLPPGLPVRLVENQGDWARVVLENGWSGWVDRRPLAPLR